MPFSAAMSLHPLPTHAIGEVVGQVLDDLGEAPDAAVLVATGPFAGAMEDLAATVRATLRPGALIGTTARSVLAGTQEAEDTGAVVLFGMRFGPKRRFGTSGLARAVGFDVHQVDDGLQLTATADIAQPRATLLLLADPYTFPTEAFVADVTARTPGLTVVGGMASAADAEGGNRFVRDGVVTDRGAVGLLLPPGLGAQPLVSQGCRPVGEPLVVTASSGTMIEEIAGQPALDRLMAQADSASTSDRNRMARGLHLGIVVDERALDPGPGDFLVRNVLGADHERGAIAVDVEVPVGTTIQFQVRDAAAADEDLHALLAETTGSAAFVFTCLGRGQQLFGTPNHDAEAFSEHLRGGAVAGMFCAAEVGPVGDAHHVHTMTASALVFDEPR